MESKSVRYIYCIGLILIVILVVIFILGALGENFEDPRIEISNGKLKGRWMYTTNGRSVEAYLGIPFAKPPIGELRFKAPVEPDSWSGELDATNDIPTCTQFQEDVTTDTTNPVIIGQEDCLYLSVFKPKIERINGSLPVLVFIYPGGLIKGSPTVKNFGPEILLNKDMILVTLNYRVELLGFLSMEDKIIPGNFGVKDQVAALRWVKKNIKYFNGDPERVTIHGLSSGAATVQFLMYSPMAIGLFHKAISSSGNIFEFYPPPEGVATQRAKKLIDLVKCPTENSTAALECLQKLPVKELFSHHQKFKVWANVPTFIFGITFESEADSEDMDGPFITRESLKTNTSIPHITGIVSGDGLFKTIWWVNEPDLLSQLNNVFDKLGPTLVRYDTIEHIDPDLLTIKLKEYYLKGENISRKTFPQLTNLFTDTLMFYGVLQTLQKHSGNVYIYYFTHRGQYSRVDKLIEESKPDDTKAFLQSVVSHGDELQYIFPARTLIPKRKKIKFTKQDQFISDQFLRLISDFVINREMPKEWNKTSFENLEYMQFGTNEVKMKKHLLQERSQFWYDWLQQNFYPKENDETALKLVLG